MTKAELRTQIRRKRQQLSSTQMADLARSLLAQIQTLHLLDPYHHIAFYLKNDHEIDPSRILELALSQNKTCYLPAIQPDSNVLKFVRYQPHDALQKNRYGILEPKSEQALSLEQLDLVFVPLVAFDHEGYRLGMGAGFYDATFAFRKKKKKPLLIGLAYDFQQVPHIPHESWDIKLDKIITETRVITIAEVPPVSEDKQSNLL